MTTQSRKRLGEILVNRNLLLPEQLEDALAKQRHSGKRLGQVLIDMGFVNHDDVAEAVSEQSGVPHVWLRKGLVDPEVVAVLPQEKAVAYKVIPMFRVYNTLTLGMTDATNIFAIDDVEILTGCRVQAVQCREDDVLRAIKEYHSDSMEVEDFIESFNEADVTVAEDLSEDLQMVDDAAEGAKVINLVNVLILNAIKEGASDVHIEPDTQVTHVRYRIDGALQEVMETRRDMHAAVVSRMKVMAKLDIAERRIPQDGRFRVSAEGRDVDVRVSSMPTVNGSKIVLRLLDSTKITLDINTLGYHNNALHEVKEMLKRPNGMILVTGPTGSGKTTSLYSALTHIKSVERNITTIEDPVEYQLPMTTQIQVNEDQGLTFPSALRSVLRQDPDVIMVGEIRDRATAEVAVQAALTGHLVLATLHTNECASAIARLLDMGIEPYMITSSVIGVIGQRLLRKVCDNCRTNHFPPANLLQRIGWSGSNTTFSIGRGCEQCFDSGLRGRLGVFEVLTMTDELRREVTCKASSQKIKEIATRGGMRTLRDEALRLVEERQTSLDEAMRVVFVDDAPAGTEMAVPAEV